MAFLRLVREKVELVKKDAGSSTSSSLGESEETTADTQRAEGESSNDAMSHTTSHQALKDLPSGDKNAEPHGSLASPDEITSKTSSKKSLTSPPDAEPTSGSSAENTASRTTPTSGSKPKLPLHKSHPVCLSMMSSGGTALSALASTSDPLLEEELVKRRKVEPVADQLQLLDTLSLSEEKKVGPDIPQGIGSADLKSAEQQKLEVSEAVASEPRPQHRVELLASLCSALCSCRSAVWNIGLQESSGRCRLPVSRGVPHPVQCGRLDSRSTTRRHRGRFWGRGWYRVSFRVKGWYRVSFRVRGWYKVSFRVRGWYRVRFRVRGWYRVSFRGRGWYRVSFRGRGWYRVSFRGMGWY